MINLNETINKIKAVGAAKVRSVPVAGQNVNDGLYQIEIMENDTWTPIATNLPRTTAEDLIKQATNRVICG